MNLFYCYLPISNVISEEELKAAVESFCKGKVVTDPSEARRSYCNLKIQQENSHLWVNVLSNVTFASDPRSFLRLRIDGCHSKTIDALIQRAKELDGFYGDNSKEFLDSKGMTIFNIKDGETEIKLSIGEVISRIGRVYPELETEIPRDTSNETYAKLYKEHLGVEIKPVESNQFLMPVPLQSTSVR
ncbi:hypothetical protein [Vibrio harveyi]|uniref:hypothetical protein n=1 Tax=Vibrio harveyi TaxID=669 RepID=UPI003CF7AA06